VLMHTLAQKLVDVHKGICMHSCQNLTHCHH
jgi:hypothetical protein